MIANAEANAVFTAAANTAARASASTPTTSVPGAGALATLVDSGLAQWDSSSGGGMSVPMPFENHVCLIEDTHVAGTTHISDIDELAAKISEGQKLRFERQPDNMHDKWAIRVFAADDRIGYVPCTTNEILARLMDAGKCIGGKVTYCEKLGTWHKIHMEVYLDD